MRFRSDPSQLRGAITPLVTPFHDDGALDLESVGRLVDWQLEHGSHGISVGGSTGEPAAQSVAERIEVMRAAARAVGDRVPFLPGSGTARLDETLELTAAAEALGADAVLVITPFYARPTQEGLYHWYATVAREFPELPIVIYNVPVRAAVDIAPATVARLAREHANIVGIKETTRDFEHVSHVLNLCGPDFLAYSGIELLCYPMLALGGAGHLSCVANFAPRPVAQLYDEFAAGRHEEARRLHYELHPLVELAFLETNPAPVKWAMAELGLLPSSHARAPLAPLSTQSRERARGLLAESAHVPASVAAR
ncbi:MAG: 4-hydroxy-tetrahydrodipicolinate synthase [Solirubrobacterales bacterium]|nr:4-hydroxy-tetrahydrodipicolinate synthase [Solirubrobacterales bacterium]